MPAEQILIPVEYLYLALFFLIAVLLYLIFVLYDKSRFRTVVVREQYMKNDSDDYILDISFEVLKTKKPRVLTQSEKLFNISIRNSFDYIKESLYEEKIEHLITQLRLMASSKVNKSVIKSSMGGK